jgi:ADP-ribosyl-[dinitrogen reductase] hydrolase
MPGAVNSSLVPIPNSYWVEPSRLLAGEYPGKQSRADTLARLKQLLEAGVSYFIDLTTPGELPPYDAFLPGGKGPGGRHVMYVRKPIGDHTVPAAPEMMAEILDCLASALAGGYCVYLHCRAGIGRTGTVLGCHLVSRGMEPQPALDHLQQLWEASGRSAVWPYTPETDEQMQYVRAWRELSRQSPSLIGPAIGPQELAIARNLRDRCLGSLLGLAIGDALGASVQYRKPGTFTPLGDLLGGGPLELPRGAWSDDTAIALCLAESLLECKGFDAADQMLRYQRWQSEGYLSSTGQCIGITAAVALALATARWSGKPYAGSHDPTRLDKEAITRVAPVALYFMGQPAAAIEQAAQAARTTHQSPIVLDACRYVAALLLGALRGVHKQELLAAAYARGENMRTLRCQPVLAVAAGSFRTKSPPQIEGGGTVINALEAALWALYRSSNFREGALLAVNLGLDADVTGALYGQLAGALYGVNGIPSAWRKTLLKHSLIEDFADRLLAQALEGMAEI